MSDKRFTAIILSCTALLAITCACTTNSEPAAITVCASIEETDDKLRVFVGDIENAPEDYAQKRADYLESIADTEESMSALIGFDDYYTAQDVITLTEKYDAVIDRAYMWPEGETGRLMFFVEDGDLEASIETYKTQIAADDSDDPEIVKDQQRFLDGDYGVFALVVTAPAKSLEEMSSQADCISYVDVLYNAEVEEYAEKVGKTVHYIDSPAKPDGAL